METTFNHRHHDDEAFDEVIIRTIPRWKTSGLSGDEWRTSAQVQFRKKGELIWERSFRNVECAINALPWFFMTCGELGETDDKAWERAKKKCDQPGCSEFPSITYQLKKLYSREGYSSDPTFKSITKFCDKHKHRGDCGLEDADENYLRIDEMNEEKKSDPTRISTAEKLAKAMKDDNCPEWIIQKALKYQYDDFRSHSATPCIDLVNDLQQVGAMELRERAKSGEFDAQKWESDEWANGPAGRGAMKEFTPELKAKLFGITDA